MEPVGAIAVTKRRHNIDGKAVALALRLQEFRRAGAIGAEMKIEADRRAADGKTLHQYPLDEIFRAEFGQGGVEGKHDCAVKSGGGEKPQFGGFVSKSKQRLIRTEECPRMRLEGKCGSGFPERMSARKRRTSSRSAKCMTCADKAASSRGLCNVNWPPGLT